MATDCNFEFNPNKTKWSVCRFKGKRSKQKQYELTSDD